jgi:ATP-binding cassette subfamily C protein LapB
LLIAKPNILLLDEPTASMDNELEAHVMRGIFANMRQGSSIVLATHKMGLLNLVDRIIVMSQGKVVADGPRDQILQKMFAKKPSKSPRDVLDNPQELET